MSDDPASAALRDLRLIQQGDPAAVARMFSRYRERLARVVQFRLDQRLKPRLDVDDILQEAFLDIQHRADRFEGETEEALFLWFRLVLQQTMINIHRRHMGTQARDPRRERRSSSRFTPESTSFSLSQQLLGHLTSPSAAVLRQELAVQLDLALEGLEEVDREVLALRHFEELTNRETAAILGLSEAAASVRYVRALGRLRKSLESISGLSEVL